MFMRFMNKQTNMQGWGIIVGWPIMKGITSSIL